MRRGCKGPLADGGGKLGGPSVIPVFDESSLRYPIGGMEKRAEWSEMGTIRNVG